MDQRALVVRLETPFAHYNSADAPVRDVLVAGLSWPADTASGYWQGLAIAWIEQGAPMDAALAELVKAIAATGKLPQNLRHRARSIARRFDRANVPAEQHHQAGRRGRVTQAACRVVSAASAVR